MDKKLHNFDPVFLLIFMVPTRAIVFGWNRKSGAYGENGFGRNKNGPDGGAHDFNILPRRRLKSWLDTRCKTNSHITN